MLSAAVRPQDNLPAYPPVVPGHALSFPSDYGAHPDFRTEWWYITGWLETAGGKPLGFQVTFFRSRPPLDQTNPSRFAPTELLFAHAAVSDPALGSLQHEQRAARSGFGLAEAARGDTDVHIGAWSLQRDAGGTYRTMLDARDFTFELVLRPPQPPLLQGERGYSRKGPLPAQASYYYSQPQLGVSGVLTRQGVRENVRGTAWLDHEWSSALLAEQAVGWDWIGINLDDGGALMAFQIRDKSGGKFWAGGALRHADGSVTRLPAAAVNFVPRRRWRSPRTGTEYPVSMQVHAGELALDLVPLMDDQELDSRASTGAIYWEGAVTALRGAQVVGHGYLELTGYFRRLDL
ncbi:lipocalin-like domain-containing protein [Pandoraea terrae]|nr:carotenoid 1,2-hydratase [Pandoraea terrae]